MRNMLIATAAAALCAASVPAAAQEAGQDNGQAAQPAQPRARSGDSDQRRICVNERVSESRMTRRICRTAREWRELNDTDFGN
jgi:hypothetical protein